MRQRATHGRVAKRMPAAERRRGIVRAATRVFAERGYGGATTAAIAKVARVNEALLFRHFGSKAGLYVACIDDAWRLLRDQCDAQFAAQPEGAHWGVAGRAFLELLDDDPDRARIWVRALVETTGVRTIDRFLETLMHDVHAYVAAAFARSIAAGTVRKGADASLEAWLVIALGLLGSSLATRGIVERAELDRVVAVHRELVLGGR